MEPAPVAPITNKPKIEVGSGMDWDSLLVISINLISASRLSGPLSTSFIAPTLVKSKLFEYQVFELKMELSNK